MNNQQALNATHQIGLSKLGLFKLGSSAKTSADSRANSRATNHAGPKVKTEYGQVDWWLLAIVLTLLCLGLLMVLSASGVVGERLLGNKYFFFKKQIIFAVSGGIALAAAAWLPRNLLDKLAYPALFLAFILLALCLSPAGVKVNGASRWLVVAGFSIQPMEFARISLVLYLAYYMSTKQDMVKTFSRGVIPPFAVTGTLCCLLLLQPDFGGAILMLALLFFMCLVGGTRFFYLFFAVTMTFAGAAALVLCSPYRARRLLAFLDPFKDAMDTGYQLVQSFYALGSGGFFGVGMGNSRQKMLYLPEAHNDFIMAVVGEELGFIGITLIMLLFAMLFTRCYRIIMGQQNLRDRLTAFGLTLIIALGAVLNMAVVLGMAPPKGMSMPLISYGGSNLLASLIAIGLILNYSRTMRE